MHVKLIKNYREGQILPYYNDDDASTRAVPSDKEASGTLAFLKEVKKHKDLHNILEARQKNTIKRNWDLVGKKFKITGEQARQKYRSICNSFKRRAIDNLPYTYQMHMQFAIKHLFYKQYIIQAKATAGSIIIEPDDEDTADEEESGETDESADESQEPEDKQEDEETGGEKTEDEDNEALEFTPEEQQKEDAIVFADNPPCEYKGNNDDDDWMMSDIETSEKPEDFFDVNQYIGQEYM